MCRFNELRNKEVINAVNGKRLGFVCDVDVDMNNGRIISLIVPAPRQGIFPFGKDDEYVIKWDSIKKIGDDIIIVETADC